MIDEFYPNSEMLSLFSSLEARGKSNSKGMILMGAENLLDTFECVIKVEECLQNWNEPSYESLNNDQEDPVVMFYSEVNSAIQSYRKQLFRAMSNLKFYISRFQNSDRLFMELDLISKKLRADRSFNNEQDEFYADGLVTLAQIIDGSFESLHQSPMKRRPFESKYDSLESSKADIIDRLELINKQIHLLNSDEKREIFEKQEGSLSYLYISSKASGEDTLNLITASKMESTIDLKKYSSATSEDEHRSEELIQISGDDFSRSNKKRLDLNFKNVQGNFERKDFSSRDSLVLENEENIFRNVEFYKDQVQHRFDNPPLSTSDLSKVDFSKKSSISRSSKKEDIDNVLKQVTSKGSFKDTVSALFTPRQKERKPDRSFDPDIFMDGRFSEKIVTSLKNTQKIELSPDGNRIYFGGYGLHILDVSKEEYKLIRYDAKQGKLFFMVNKFNSCTV